MTRNAGLPYLQTKAGKAVIDTLTQTPMTAKQVAELTGHHISVVSSALAEAFDRGLVKRTKGMGPSGTGRPVFLWASAISFKLVGHIESRGTFAPAERGEYTGEPRPVRYVPRVEPYISLLCGS